MTSPAVLTQQNLQHEAPTGSEHPHQQRGAPQQRFSKVSGITYCTSAAEGSNQLHRFFFDDLATLSRFLPADAKLKYEQNYPAENSDHVSTKAEQVDKSHRKTRRFSCPPTIATSASAIFEKKNVQIQAVVDCLSLKAFREKEGALQDLVKRLGVSSVIEKDGTDIPFKPATYSQIIKVIKEAMRVWKESDSSGIDDFLEAFGTLPMHFLNDTALTALFAPPESKCLSVNQLRFKLAIAQAQEQEAKKTVDLMESITIRSLHSDLKDRNKQIAELKVKLAEAELRLASQSKATGVNEEADPSDHSIAVPDTPGETVANYKLITSFNRSDKLNNKITLDEVCGHEVEGYDNKVDVVAILAPHWVEFARNCGFKSEAIEKTTQANNYLACKGLMQQLMTNGLPISGNAFTWKEFLTHVGTIDAVRENEDIQAILAQMDVLYWPS